MSFPWESRRDGMAGRRPAPQGKLTNLKILYQYLIIEGPGIVEKLEKFLRPAILSLQLSLRKSLGKPIPSLHWLIRIYHSLPSLDGRYIILFHPFPVTGRV